MVGDCEIDAPMSPLPDKSLMGQMLPPFSQRVKAAVWFWWHGIKHRYLRPTVEWLVQWWLWFWTFGRWQQMGSLLAMHVEALHEMKAGAQEHDLLQYRVDELMRILEDQGVVVIPDTIEPGRLATASTERMLHEADVGAGREVNCGGPFRSYRSQARGVEVPRPPECPAPAEHAEEAPPGA